MPRHKKKGGIIMPNHSKNCEKAYSGYPVHMFVCMYVCAHFVQSITLLFLDGFWNGRNVNHHKAVCHAQDPGL